MTGKTAMPACYISSMHSRSTFFAYFWFSHRSAAGDEFASTR